MTIAIYGVSWDLRKLHLVLHVHAYSGGSKGGRVGMLLEKE